MKSILKLVLWIAALIGSVSCTEQAQTIKEYSIEDIINNSTPITLSEMGVELETIKLKTPKDILISSPSIIYTTPTDIFIQARHQIYRFDRDGNFLNKISTRGKAKNEYNGVYSMFGDTNGNIFIQDRTKNLTFTPGGEFIEPTEMEQKNNKIRATKSSMSRMFMDKKGNLYESFMVVMGVGEYNIIVTNPAQDTLLANSNRTIYDFDPSDGIHFHSDSRTVYSVGDEIAFQQQFCDTVFTFNSNNNTLKPRFNFKNSTPVTSEVCNSILGGKYNEFTLVSDLTEDSKYIYANISNKGKSQLYLIDKKSGESFKADFNLNHKEDDELAFYPRWDSNNEYTFFYDVTQDPEPTILLMKKL